MTETFRRRSRRISAILAVVPLALAGLAGWAAVEYRNRIQMVSHTIDVLNHIDVVMLTLTRAESSQRGYLLTQRPAYLNDYRKASSEVRQEIRDLRDRCSDNPIQRRNVDKLQPLVEARTESFERVLELRSSAHGADVDQGVREGVRRGNELMDQIRNLAAAMSAEELGLLEERRTALSRVELSAALLFTGTVILALVLLYIGQRLIVQFAIARAEAEAALQRLNAELEHRVEERTADLIAANEQLQRSNEDLTRFAYVASHDLQEPLRTIGSYAGLLGRRYQGKLDAQADGYLHHVVDGAKRMQNLVQDLLRYSRLGTQALKMERVNMEDVLRQALANLQAIIAESHAEITHDKLPWVEGDAGRLALVLQNLIANSLKFRRRSEPARVHVSAEAEHRNWVFHIRDNGIGFEPEYAERIFVLFQRLHEVGAFPGTGIGLAICKRIVEGHGGRIWAKSTPGVGSTFSFTLPPHQHSPAGARVYKVEMETKSTENNEDESADSAC